MKFQYLETVGFLPNLSEQYPKDSSIVDADYLIYDPTLKKVPTLLTHAYVTPSWKSIAKQFSLFDVEIQEDMIPHAEIEWGIQQVEQELLDFGFDWEEIPLSEVEWNLKSSAGALLAEKTKGKWLENNEHNLQYIYETAHKFPNVRILHKVSGKAEYLPFSKIHEENHRCFEISPVHLLVATLPLSQPFNKKLYEMHKLDYCVGITYQHGGFDAFARWILSTSEDLFYGMDDFRKWDKRFHETVRKGCVRIRASTYKGKMTKTELLDRLTWSYDKKTGQAFCLLPWGQVVKVPWRMLSGDDSTTSDNTLGVKIVAFAFVKYYIPEITTYHEAKRHFRVYNYADDHLYRAPCSKLGEFLTSFEPRFLFCALNSMELKREDHKRVRNTLEGLTFLGATFKLEKGIWVPVYDIQRIFSAIVMQNPNIKLKASKFMKLVSLLVLAAFSEPNLFDSIRKYALWFSEKYRQEIISQWSLAAENREFDLPLLLVPSRQYCQLLWTGQESGADWRPVTSRHILFDQDTTNDGCFEDPCETETDCSGTQIGGETPTCEHASGGSEGESKSSTEDHEKGQRAYNRN